MQSFKPLYEKLADFYENKIIERALLPGEKIDSISVIQKKHSVARETAKRCLKILVDKGLIVQRVGQGSFVANLGPKKKVWGFIIPFFSIHYDECVQKFKDRASLLDRQFHCLCSYDKCDEELRIVSTMVQQRYEAIIVVPTKEEAKTKEFYLSLSLQDSKIIFFDSVLFNTSFSYSIQNYGIGVIRAMDYIAQQVNGSVVFVKDELWHENSPMFEMMENIFIDDHYKRMGQYEPITMSRIDKPNLEAVLRKGVVGFLCCNDYRAITLLGILKSMNVKNINQMPIVSFGNTDIAKYFTPAITSIDFNYTKMINAVVNIITDSRAEQQVVVDVELIKRKT